METWSTHHLYRAASAKLGDTAAVLLKTYAQRLISKDLAVVFSLGHLARITGVSYRMLHATVNRTRESSNYRMYAVKKRSGGRRFIHAVSGDLAKVQKFISQEILQKCQPHVASFAFHRSGGIRKCALNHCGARWLFQYDLKDFFYDITESDVYKIFLSLGYRPLLSFEMARLCTTTHLPRSIKPITHYAGFDEIPVPGAEAGMLSTLAYPDKKRRLGVLPQGASTSPMLSNLAALELDNSLSRYAADNGFIYTRYADDITVSATVFPRSISIGSIHRNIVHRIRKAGFFENKKKTHISGPGSKKLVLGLLVDGEEPRISKETYHRIERHVYATSKFGLTDASFHERFDSAYGYFNHISGLIAFVKDVDKKRWEEFETRMKGISLSDI